MIYTVGNERNYDQEKASRSANNPMAKLGPQPSKTSWDANYLGGIAFETAEAAQAYAEEQNTQNDAGYAVYELEGRWPTDVYRVQGEAFHRINKDLIVGNKVLRAARIALHLDTSPDPSPRRHQ